MEEPPRRAQLGRALSEALAGLAGARIEAAHVSPAAALIAVAVYAGARRVLGVGIGPRVAGVGLLPRLPKIRASATHPLVAAMRAHLVGRQVLAIEVGAGGVVLSAGGAGSDGEQSPSARLVLVPGRHGEVRLLGEAGQIIARWPPQAPAPPGEITYPEDPAEAGAALVDASDAAAAHKAKAELARAVKTRLAALERRAEAVRGDLARLGSVALLQKTGQLLLVQSARIPRGATKVELEDWETGGKLEVALDPARPAKAQAEALFAKARRYQRGEAAMRARLAETERSALALAALAADVARAEPSLDALAELATRGRSLGVSSAAAAPSAGASDGAAPRAAGATAPRRPFHVFRGASGAAILVGRGGADNDALTTRHARPHDLWLHAKGIAGAHVVVPLAKGASCPAELLVDAATLAAHFSDARGEPVCDVSYVSRRYVRKPRGAAPGAVTFDREKVIALRVEEGRLSRLLATKEEP